MRIAKATLFRIWVWTNGLGLAAFAVLAVLDLKLKALSGVGTTDLQSLASAVQFRAAFWAWAPQPYAVRAGFNLGLDYLLMPLYAASFYFSGILLAVPVALAIKVALGLRNERLAASDRGPQKGLS